MASEGLTQGPGPGRGHADHAADGRLGVREGPLAVEGRMVERGRRCCRNKWGEMVVSFRSGTFGMLPPPLLTCLTLDETSNLNFLLIYKKWKKQDLSISLPLLMKYGAQIMVVIKYLCCKQFTKKPIKMMVTLNLGKAI